MDVISGRQKAGLVIAGLLSLVNAAQRPLPRPRRARKVRRSCVLVLGIDPRRGRPGRRRDRLAHGQPGGFRVTAGALVINVIAALPAFFVDVPAVSSSLVAISVVITVLAHRADVLRPARRPVAVLD